jgi:purine-binding chemotaxis protein CheW
MINEKSIEQYIVFELLEQKFAVSIKNSREIIEIDHFTEVPESPDYIEGIIKLRDEIIPIINLNKKLNIEDENTKNKVIISIVKEKLLGFLVNEVSEIVEVSAIDILNVPDTAQNIKKKYLAGVIEREEELITMLKVNCIFDDIDKMNVL